MYICTYKHSVRSAHRSRHGLTPEKHMAGKEKKPDKEPGYVYILTNPSFREDWVKIGKSSRSVNVRSKELDNTAVPLPFEIYATLRTVKYNEAECMIHGMIDDLTHLRIRRTREFFNVQPNVALEQFRRLATVIDDAVITLYKDNKPVASPDSTPGATTKPTRTTKRGRFRFSMVGIQAGDRVTFAPTGETFAVASDNEIEHAGKRYKLSQFCRLFMPEERRTPTNAYQGACFFTYQGQTLEQLRRQAEANSATDETEAPEEAVSLTD